MALAGKSTTVSMLRGDIRPSGRLAQLYIGELSLLRNREAARQLLGVCPQYDAIDLMTVKEHLTFYASIRGVGNTAVDHMIRKVGLHPFADRLAEKLSGGNKRKLSLAIALIGRQL
jgi:ATP-binding cassette subfamily A (ABC1) protein 3